MTRCPLTDTEDLSKLLVLFGTTVLRVQNKQGDFYLRRDGENMKTHNEAGVVVQCQELLGYGALYTL